MADMGDIAFALLCVAFILILFTALAAFVECCWNEICKSPKLVLPFAVLLLPEIVKVAAIRSASLTVMFTGMMEAFHSLWNGQSNDTRRDLLFLFASIMALVLKTVVSDSNKSLVLVSCCICFYGLQRKIRQDVQWPDDLQETLVISFGCCLLVLYANDYGVSFPSIWKAVVLVTFWWPLIDRTITNAGILSRVVLMSVYPLAYSDLITSYAWRNSQMRKIMNNYDILPILSMIMVAVAVNGLKGKFSTIQQRGFPILRHLNYWALFGLIMFPILTEKICPMTQGEIPKEFENYGTIGSMFNLVGFKRTPLVFSLLHKYNLI